VLGFYISQLQSFSKYFEMEYSRTILGAILIHSFLLVFSQAYTKINEFSDQRAWIRLCKSGGGENILGVEAGSRCSSGFWFKDPLKVSCACGHGVYDLINISLLIVILILFA
jgi:hypothetical protein